MGGGAASRGIKRGAEINPDGRGREGGKGLERVLLCKKPERVGRS